MFMERETARKLACAVMQRLTIYPGDLENLTNALNIPDADIWNDLTDVIEGFDPSLWDVPAEEDLKTCVFRVLTNAQTSGIALPEDAVQLLVRLVLSGHGDEFEDVPIKALVPLVEEWQATRKTEVV